MQRSFSWLYTTIILLLCVSLFLDITGFHNQVKTSLADRSASLESAKEEGKNENVKSEEGLRKLSSPDKIVDTASSSILFDRPGKCTEDQLARIHIDLPDIGNGCSIGSQPWLNICSITKATSCPDGSWIEEYYQDHFNSKSFLAINIGCNKGFDAVNLLRMGRNDPSIGRHAWAAATPEFKSATSVCQQNNADGQFNVHGSMGMREDVRIFCVEPMPSTVAVLARAASETGFQTAGLTVRQYAINNDEAVGSTLFPKPAAQSAGVENVGIDQCTSKKMRQNCEPVKTARVDHFVDLEGIADTKINMLTIDVEGWDYEVLQGASSTLERTEYVEFEFNWRGKWKDAPQPAVKNAINFLDEKGLTCYWAGWNMLWRITDCWMDHYAGWFWSNVACVNRRENPVLARIMEDKFLATIGRPVNFFKEYPIGAKRSYKQYLEEGLRQGMDSSTANDTFVLPYLRKVVLEANEKENMKDSK